MDSEHFASAAALLRPIAEASACSHWVSYVAPKAWVDSALTSQAWDQPNLDNMIRALAKSGTKIAGIGDLLTLLRTPAWKRYHSFTHGGIEQLERRGDLVTFDPMECRANFLMADNFVLAGASIYTAWFETDAISDFIRGESQRIGREIKEIFAGPEVPEWTGLPPPIQD